MWRKRNGGKKLRKREGGFGKEEESRGYVGKVYFCFIGRECVICSFLMF